VGCDPARCGGVIDVMLRGRTAMRAAVENASFGPRSLSCSAQSRTSSASSIAETQTRPRNKSSRRSRCVRARSPCPMASLPTSLLSSRSDSLVGSIRYYARSRLLALCLPPVEAACGRPCMATVHPLRTESGIYVPCMGGDVQVRPGPLYRCASLRASQLLS
jgi:hypothetical protein